MFVGTVEHRLVPQDELIDVDRHRARGPLGVPPFDTGLKRGDVEIEEDFKNLFAYSPYHNIRKGHHYPPTLITTDRAA